MKEQILEIKNQLVEDIKSVNSPQDIVDIKAKYIGKTGLVTGLMKNMKDYAPEERKEIGQMVNEIKNEVSEIIQNRENEIKIRRDRNKDEE